MAVSLKNIYENTKEKFKLELLAGADGLENTVSWVHLIEDVTTTDFIRGSELIITTGLGMDDEYWLLHFIENLNRQHAVGIIVNIGTYIKEVPEHTISYCESIQFPLFILPWEIHLVDIMQDISNHIIRSEQIEINESTAFWNALYTPENKDSYEHCLEQGGFQKNGSYCVLIIHANEANTPNFETICKKLRITARNILNRFAIKFSIISINQEICIIFHNLAIDNLKKITEKLYLGCGNDYAFLHLQFGLGPSILGIENLFKSYKRGQDILRIGKNQKQDIIFYDDIGINKVLLAVEDKQVLKDMYKETLGVLEDYDNNHGTDYLNVLRLYLANNFSVQAVADQTYTHRNTINYRIKKIKELLFSELTSMEERFRYQMAYYIHDILTNPDENV
jgi:PucR family transcriptional regulator, proline-responsive transcriptional activator